MQETLYAVLDNGEKIPYIWRPDPPRGGMKHTYFAPDKSYVVQFFNDPAMAGDEALAARLEAIIGRYNPAKSEREGGAKGNTAELAAHFAGIFCWPTHIVRSPEFGIVCPTYPSRFFFDASSSAVLNLTGKDKKSNWFTGKNRRYLAKHELGDLKKLLQMSMMLSRGIRRMHQAGLAHSDLSHNNVLIDPQSASCVIIDIDSLVVPGIFPPEVVGTRGYMAPEVMTSLALPYGHPDRVQPSVYTDLHALPVLIYEYLFCRHPLYGPKVYSAQSAEDDDFLALGPAATFIENPFDFSNRPDNLRGTIKDLGPYMEKLFLRAFVDGLHEPELRPSALEWEKGIASTLDMLCPCGTGSCEKKWFVLSEGRDRCPICGTAVTKENRAAFDLCRKVRGREGHYLKLRRMCVTDGTRLYSWHLYDNVYCDEKARQNPVAEVKKQDGKWFLINSGAEGFRGPDGRRIPVGGKAKLEKGSVLLPEGENGMALRFCCVFESEKR